MDRTVEVLFVNENIGGHQTVHRNLEAEFSQRRDINAQFLDLDDGGILRRLASAQLPVVGQWDLDLQPIRAQLSRSFSARRASNFMANVDLVHFYTQNAALMSAGLLRRVPSVISTDSTNELNAYRIPYRRPTRATPWSVPVSKMFERRPLRAADFVVATTDWVRTSLVKSYGLDARYVRLIRFGIIGPTHVDVGPRDPSMLPQIIFVGNQLAAKGGIRLLQLHQQHLRDRSQLILVTQEPPEPAHNVRVVTDITPGSPRLWDLLKAADLFVFPSEIDQAPNVVLEAMAAALPVVALPVAGIAEMVDHGRTGLLVRPNTDEGLVGAIDALLRSHALCREYGEAGRRKFLSEFQMSITCDRLLDTFHDAIERHKLAGVLNEK